MPGRGSYADGLFDVLIVHGSPMPAFLRVFPKVYSGTHVTHAAVEIQRAAGSGWRRTGIVIAGRR